MACTHADGCPLFPKLKDSLVAWRVAYCDNDTRYPTCARYRVSLTGEPVPLALLPTGKLVSHFSTRQPADATATSSCSAGVASSTAVLDAPEADPEPSAYDPAARRGLWRRRTSSPW